MGVETTYPMTIGQLSVYRDVQALPEDRRWEANLPPFVWDLRQSRTPEEIWAALGELAMRHESLRTNYLADSSGALLQYIAADDAATVMAQVAQGTADIGELPALEESSYRWAIDVHSEMPWRAWVITEAGDPVKLLVVVNHVAADGAAALIMQDDFHALLAGNELPPPSGQPRLMALDQQGAGAGRLRAAERYWRRTLEAAPRITTGRPVDQPMIGGTLHTGIPLEAAHEGATRLEVSLATVVLAAYYRALRRVTGQSEVLLLQISANRFDPAAAMMVTSLNQWAATLLSFDEGEPFDEVARRTHWKAFNGLKNSICDPDAVLRMREEFFEKADPPVDPGYNFNAILAPQGFAPAVDQEPASTEFYEPARATGPAFYLIARGIETIDLVVRTTRPEVDRSGLAEFFASMQEDLLGAAGLPAM